MWRRGDVIVRREVLNDGRVWAGTTVHVVQDKPDLLATYIAEGAPLAFPPGPWPIDGGRHPWHGKRRWKGHGALMLQRPRDAYAVWVFWHGPAREFRGWYVNLQAPFRRTPIGYDTQDFELDILVPLDDKWSLKDAELLDHRVREGRFTAEQARAIRSEGDRIGRDLDARRYWWSDEWASWQQDPSWQPAALPDGWNVG
jgi:hypothetical protein